MKFNSLSESSQKAAESELGAVAVPECCVLLDNSKKNGQDCPLYRTRQ